VKGPLVLAFDTATPAGSVALVDGNAPVSRYFDVGCSTPAFFLEVEEALKVAAHLDQLSAMLRPSAQVRSPAAWA
jgi:hypothetical protein